MGVTNQNTHIFGGQQVIALNAYRYAHSGCKCKTLHPHHSYSFAPWIATTRHHHPRCICTASQFSNGDRRYVLAPLSPPQPQHVPPTPFILHWTDTGTAQQQKRTFGSSGKPTKQLGTTPHPVRTESPTASSN
ncbi:hypothetical protein L211DRAFT_445390 [Terfezia boudieri ATCC MYA-4762]|uniref:Uncharacterized protein n=1 Tax=Terfezia boudieri ATCC MYA-4762 TaxID=1051890 RepID=A0A3N4LEB4_9PEZI|nr:hypothetical protein L211DRAFT_445390 [Terfezia boudieri ATCC MYA-4762]